MLLAKLEIENAALIKRKIKICYVIFFREQKSCDFFFDCHLQVGDLKCGLTRCDVHEMCMCIREIKCLKLEIHSI